MDPSNKERAEFIRLGEVDTHFSQERAPEYTLMAVALFVMLYMEQYVSLVIIGLSLIKLIILLVFNIIERQKCYAHNRLYLRSVQFWIYRFIFFLQLLLLLWILVKITLYGITVATTT